LSGDFADLAGPAYKGYQLWVNTVNAKGGLLGRKVSLKVVDDASNPTQVVTNYENLITADHVNLVFGPFSSLLTIPAATVASRGGTGRRAFRWTRPTPAAARTARRPAARPAGTAVSAGPLGRAAR
jgi:Periplasmic binding protein